MNPTRWQIHYYKRSIGSSKRKELDSNSYSDSYCQCMSHWLENIPEMSSKNPTVKCYSCRLYVIIHACAMRMSHINAISGLSWHLSYKKIVRSYSHNCFCENRLHRPNRKTSSLPSHCKMIGYTLPSTPDQKYSVPARFQAKSHNKTLPISAWN